MNKYIKNTFRTGMALSVAMLAFYSCSDSWDDHYDTTGDVSGRLTIWESLKKNGLTDFCEVVSKVGRDTMLNSDQTFTVWAPVNGSFNKDSLLTAVSEGKKKQVIERFVNNYISRYNISDNGEAIDITMLNSKRNEMTSGMIGDAKITSANNICSNGVLHIINNQLPFRFNIYEALELDPDFSSLYSFLSEYEEDSLDEGRSVSRGVDENGNKIWVDSVIIENNVMLNSLNALINMEDSNYWAVVPTNEAFDSRVEEAMPYFVFNPTVENADSLQELYAKRYSLYDSFFNMNQNTHPNDSLAATTYSSFNPLYNVFYHPYTTVNDTAGILTNIDQEISCSNGMAYKFSKWPLSIYDTFFREIKVEIERTSNVNTSDTYTKASNLSYYSSAADSISRGYVDIVPSSSTANPQIGVNLYDYLSGTYDIYVVMLPKTVMTTSSTDFRPYKFRATLYEMNEKGDYKQETKLMDGGTTSNNPYCVDTVYIDTHTFTNSFVGQNSYGAILTINSYILSRETSDYSREMLIDCVILKPHKDDE